MSDGGKGDWIPGTNAKAYEANYPGIDWGAREREAARRALEAAAAQVPSWSDFTPTPTTFGELSAGPVLHFSRSVLPRAPWWRRLWWRVCDAFTRPCMDP